MFLIFEYLQENASQGWFIFVVFQVPDRGGRPSTMSAPVEMPSFRKRTEAPKDQRPRGECHFLL